MRKFFSAIITTCTFIGMATLALDAQAAPVQTISIDTQVFDILTPEGGTPSSNDYKVLSTVDGRVYSLSEAHSLALTRVFEAFLRRAPVRLEVDGDAVLAAFPLGELDETPSASILPFELQATASDYAPTPLASLEQASQLFNGFNLKVWSRSQCYQRAHIWAYDLWTLYGIRSMKNFLFFTRRYIREFNYKWWFHVAPLVLVGDQQILMDPTFTDEPLPLRKWSDEFMQNHVNCPVVNSYSDYEDHQEAEYCYIQQVPMYYYQPLDVEALDKNGVQVNTFRSKDLEHMEKAKRWSF